jgi:lipoprotein-releasing system permease protein
MASRTAPFAPFEFMIAWRYLRARRAEGGVSVMTWISLIGVTLAVFALVATLAVRSGFRSEFVDTILGANAHMTIYSATYLDGNNRPSRAIADYGAIAGRLRAVPGVTHVAPVIDGKVMASQGQNTTGIEVIGMALDDLAGVPRIARPEAQQGDLARLPQGIAIGSGVRSGRGHRRPDQADLAQWRPNRPGHQPAHRVVRGGLHLHRRPL